MVRTGARTMRSSSVSIGRPRGIGGSDSGSFKALISPPRHPGSKLGRGGGGCRRSSHVSRSFFHRSKKQCFFLREESSQQQKRSGRFRCIRVIRVPTLNLDGSPAELASRFKVGDADYADRESTPRSRESRDAV